MYKGKTYKTSSSKPDQQIYSLFRKEDIVIGRYEGGSTRIGTMIGTIDEFLNLDFIYQELTQDNKMITGKGFIQPSKTDPKVLSLFRTCSLRSNKKSKFLLFQV